VDQRLAPELEKRTAGDAEPWIRMRTRHREAESLVRTLTGHTGTVTACGFSPDGRLIVSGDTDNTLKIWDAETGVELHTLLGHQAAVWDCAFSPDGTTICSAGGDYKTGELRLWDARTGAPLLEFEGHRESVSTCAFGPEGRRLFSASADGTVRVWDPRSGAEGGTVPVSGRMNNTALAVSPDGERICSAGIGGADLTVVEVASGTSVATLDFPEIINHCSFSPDGRQVVLAGGKWDSEQPNLCVWHPDTGTTLVVEAHRGVVHSCAFSPDGRQVLSAGDDGTLRLWDAQTGTQLAVLVGHGGAVTACAFSPDGRSLVSAGRDGAVRVWDTALATTERPVPEGHAGGVSGCAFTIDGARLISTGDDDSVRLWDADDAQALGSRKGPVEYGHQWAADHDLRRIVSATGERTAVWDAETGAKLFTLKGDTGYSGAGGVDTCCLSPDERRLVTVHEDIVKVWDLESHVELGALNEGRGWGGVGPPVRFSPDGSLIVTGGGLIPDDETGRRPGLRVWDAESRALLYELDGGPPVTFSPDGSRAIGSGRDRTLAVWEVSTGARLASFALDAGGVGDCAFTPDGRWIVTVEAPRRVRVREAATGSVRATFVHTTTPWGLALHPWLPRLAYGDSAGAVHRIDLVGLDYGPIVVTPVDHGSGSTATCPACRQDVPLGSGSAGEVVACPGRSCGLLLRPNGFALAGRQERWHLRLPRRSGG
jgi:WD40 repeat protein